MIDPIYKRSKLPPKAPNIPMLPIYLNPFILYICVCFIMIKSISRSIGVTRIVFSVAFVASSGNSFKFAGHEVEALWFVFFPLE